MLAFVNIYVYMRMDMHVYIWVVLPIRAPFGDPKYRTAPISIYIYDPGSRFADSPPPQWYPPPPHPPQAESVRLRTLFPHEGSKSDNCHEDRVPRRPIRVTVQIFQARLSREGAKAKAINCHEDRVSCDCRHFRKRTPT